MAPAATFPVTTFELVTLISLREGPAATQSAASLRLPDPDGPLQPRKAGLASLLARELVTIQDGTITAVGNAGGVAGALTAADRWIEVGIVRGTSSDAAILVGAGAGGVMITPRGFDVWDALPVNEGTDLVEGGVDLARRGIDVTPAGEAVAASVKVTTAAGSTSASVRREADGTWQLATEPADAEGRLTVQDVRLTDQAAAMAALLEALR
ncbi:hypothetical protein [Oerskovia flava]|uniref:hypothetical protein n=1 Tax=Oerskovia flava TaxID=2986422 RepID=UPI00223E96E9|nr:hypothetical protein [Oerskovia sp. JB1-3-2]